MPKPCEQYTNEKDCTAHGCYWYDNACHSRQKINWGKISFMLQIPFMLSWVAISSKIYK